MPPAPRSFPDAVAIECHHDRRTVDGGRQSSPHPLLDVDLRQDDLQRLVALDRKFAKEGLTFDDVLLVPAESSVLPNDMFMRSGPVSPWLEMAANTIFGLTALSSL